ncbi:MAG: monofunctional biosynthetic peptidoglycan transglycosylase [Nitrospirae bacterium RBG_16_64_22]|nr:MAG: monofunctional biosynthetic peptidoglycan transglycosylase [Nitrospirae bacterium RBG_16_64_22]
MTLPDVTALAGTNPKTTALMEQRTSEARTGGRRPSSSRVWVPLKQIAPHAVLAVVTMEDDRFWRHEGFDFVEMKEAAQKNWEKKRWRRGASTITQQLAKNLYFGTEKNLWRKVREAAAAWKIERTLPKRRILEIYLNVVEWGDGIYGIEAAARHYFGKSAADLSVEEAVRLAVVLPNPRRYDPRGSSAFVENRRDVLLSRLGRKGVSIDAELSSAMSGS